MEKEKQINNILIGSENKKLFYFLALSYSAHLSIDVHCSNEAKKNSYISTAIWLFLCFSGAKITI